MVSKYQIEEAFSHLNEAAIKLENYQETLYHQADRVKDQIKSNIEMQVDGLKQRRQWLLNQLDVVKSDKLEIIIRRQEAIKCSRAIIELIAKDSGNISIVEAQKELKNACSLLSNDPQPFLGFRADSGGMREAVSQYGCLLTQYCGHFADPSRPSLSLPRMVEDEDDDLGPRTIEVNGGCSGQLPSQVVKAWLLSDHKLDAAPRFVTVANSDSESIVRLGSEISSSPQSKKMKTDFEEVNEKEFWLSPTKTELDISGDNCDILKPIEKLKSQKKDLWLLELNRDEEKDLDHQEFVTKACVGGGCKSFQECNQAANCCGRLLDRDRPRWNKWLLSNQLVPASMVLGSSSTDCEDALPTWDKLSFGVFGKVLAAPSAAWVLPSRHEPGEGDHGQVKVARPRPAAASRQWRATDKDELARSLEQCVTRMKLAAIDEPHRWLVTDCDC